MKRFIFSALLLTSCATHKPAPVNVEAVYVEEYSSPTTKVYALYAENEEQAQYVHIMAYTPQGRPSSLGLGQVDDNGQVWSVEGQDVNPFYLALNNYGYGESIDVYVVGVNGGGKTHITPNPTEIEQDGYRFTVERWDHLGHQFHIYAEGFKPNENVSFFIQNGERIYTDNYTTSDRGDLNLIGDFSLEGHPTGLATIDVTTSQGEAHLNLPWGYEYWKNNQKFNDIQRKEDIILRDRDPSVVNWSSLSEPRCYRL